jgi:1,4-alpha-glucan branching enzyme
VRFVSARGERGALAIVLHTHMPYVEGFDTWPFGEEWLWQAMAGSYLPLLELLDRGAPLTLSLTPVLCDQLEAAGVPERFAGFVEGVCRETHESDIGGLRAAGEEALALELERSYGDYTRALELYLRRDGDMLGALRPHAQWTSSATHAVLPLLATDAGVRAQVLIGIDAHRHRFGAERWRGGFWLPECAFAPWLERPLTDAAVSAVCVELTGRFGLGSAAHLRPLVSGAGVVLVPIDRATISLVWSDGGYPASGAYRDFHHHTLQHHNPWSNDGRAYDPARATALAKEHAADFVARTIARLREHGAGHPGGGLAVFAVDTELFGHWWYEGLTWLEAVVEECARQGLELARLDDALERREPAALDGEGARARERPEEWRASTWGRNGDLSTWSGPGVAEMAFAARAAELEVLAAGARAGNDAVRELLALQASDWAFMVSRGGAAPYGRERFEGHRRALARALEGVPAAGGGPRNLAVYADRAALFAC